ncbi:MAG: response regulator, partial [Sandaracinus sp.]|nr:response regulator [Sandaracinus sp.]
ELVAAQIVARLASESPEARELREKSAMLEAILNTTVAAIVELELDGRIVYANPQAERVLGLKPSEVMELRYDAPEWHHTAPDGGPWPDEEQPFNRVVATGEPVFDVEHAIEWPDGRRRHLSINGAPIRDDGGDLKSLVFAVTDITERRRLEDAERELRHSQKMEALGTLAGGIAHDFNNHLAAILGNAELALRLVGTHPAQPLLEDIVIAARSGGSLVRQILTFADKRPGTRAQVPVAELVAEVTSLLRASTPSNVTLEAREPDAELAVLGDRSQFVQLLLNLGINAVQATRETGGRVSIDVTAVQVADGERPPLAAGRYVLASVRDTGKGIEPALLARVFEPFFTTKPQGEGTGLGLAMAHGIVERHGGAMDVRSTLGEGTTFRVWLPLATVTRTVSGTAQVGAVAPTGRLVVVDDEPVLLRALAVALQYAGHAVEAFTTPEAALARIASEPSSVDALVVDLHMPGTNGFEVMRRVRELRPKLPVVLLTGRLDGATREAAVEAGANEVLPKPCPLQELEDAIARILPAMD